MFKGIDRSPALSNFLETLSSSLAKRRGLTIVIGVMLVIISFIVHLIHLVAPLPILEVVWSITHHLGIITALIGILLIEPLGG